MEVHHHPHIEKKGFKEYFLEFLMIFLAVSMGFLAESLRENIANKEKEQHYIQNLLADLKKDTADVSNQLNLQQLLYNKMDSALHIPVERLKNINVQDTFYHHFLFFYSSVGVFIQNNSTISQLKTGGFNVIKRENVIDSINNLYSFYDALLKINGDFFITAYLDLAHIGQQVMKLPEPPASFDDPVFKVIPENTEIFTQYENHLIQQLYNVIGNEKGTLLAYTDLEKNYRKKVERLINYLNKEYHLK